MKKIHLNSQRFMIILLLILTCLNLITIRSELTSKPFDLTILGYRNWQYVAIPNTPGPNFPVNSTVPDADGLGCKELGFRLTYSGSSACNVTKLVLWQEIDIHGGYIWKPAGEGNEIVLKFNMFNQGASYDFLISYENSSKVFFFAGTILLRVSTESIGEILISTHIPDDLYPYSSLVSWPLSSTTVFSASIWTILLGCITIRVIKKTR